ncbi:reverse transcriptase domain-containing protein [Micromonospora sp. CB01531]|uniref:reverse transcriptase domain-containing protein n=1 Tax=Micromonospora sp. CB01531 TaxID=1718947 RepID=UPI002379B2C6|nr:reverse transcriptase domain-containing protein [Micromonospora sp. CB01531]
MSSGTYFPPAVKAVEISKPHGGGTRILGVPTLPDRVAQTAAALELEPRTESIFQDDSYGYRPRSSALDAIRRCRARCWKKDWVLDLDVQKFFDSVDHDLMVKAVAANTDKPWVLLYVKRWLVAPLQLPDGTMRARDRGTPQGSAVSPVLATSCTTRSTPSCLGSSRRGSSSGTRKLRWCTARASVTAALING